MHVAVVGAGVTGMAAARALRAIDPTVELTIVTRRSDRERRIGGALGDDVAAVAHLDPRRRVDVVVLCTAAGTHFRWARTALTSGAAVVSVADAIPDVRGLIDLHPEAIERHLPVVVGAGMSPGLSCVLARHAADWFDEVDEVHVAKAGTGGPACAHVHHDALTGRGWDWGDGGWVRRRGSSGRQLVWFPEPISARDCYRAALPDPFLLHRAFPRARRITARVSATRRDRLTSWLPMLRPPHADGGPGAVRVEVWGRRDGTTDVLTYGAAGHPAAVSGVVAATAVFATVDGRLPGAGVSGLAEVEDPTPFLAGLERLGVRTATFEGAP